MSFVTEGDLSTINSYKRNRSIESAENNNPYSMKGEMKMRISLGKASYEPREVPKDKVVLKEEPNSQKIF